MSKKKEAVEAPDSVDLDALIAQKDRERRHSKGLPEKTGEPRGRQLSDKIFVIDRSSRLYVKGGK
jgi:hypothetical protein